MTNRAQKYEHADLCRLLAARLAGEGWSWEGTFTEHGSAVFRSAAEDFTLRAHPPKGAVYGGAKTIRITGHFGPLNSRVFPAVSSTLRFAKSADEIADAVISGLIPRCRKALVEAKRRVGEREAEHLRDYDLAASLYAVSGGRIVVADDEAPVGRPWRLKAAPRPRGEGTPLPHEGPWYLIGGEVMFGRVDLHLGGLTPEQVGHVLRVLNSADGDGAPESTARSPESTGVKS